MNSAAPASGPGDPHSRRDPTGWRACLGAETTLFLLIWLGLVLGGRTALFRDPGTFWHTMVGERMLHSGQLVRSDPFSFTRQHHPWVPHQWLAECGMAALYRLGGWDAMLLVGATVLAALYAWVAMRWLRAGFHWLAMTLLVALVLLASAPQFHIRPLILSIALLGGTYALLVDVEAGRRHVAQLVWLVPLVGLWANLHAAVLAGIGTLGLVALGWCLAWWLGRPSPLQGPRTLVLLVVVVTLCCLSVLVNPYGLDLPRAWLATLALPLPTLIQEHRPVDLTSPLGLALIVLGCGYLVALAGTSWRRIRPSWLVPLIWLLLACQRVRHAPLFAVTAAIALAEILPESRWRPWLQDRELLPRPAGTAPPRHRRNCLAVALPAVAVLLVGLIDAAGSWRGEAGARWVKLDTARWPVELLPPLAKIEAAKHPQPLRIFNDMNFGGFLIFYAPHMKIFIDDRCALYGGQFLQAYDHARREDPAQLDIWQQAYGFRYALVEAGKPFDAYLRRSDRWLLLQRARAAALYQLREDPG